MKFEQHLPQMAEQHRVAVWGRQEFRSVPAGTQPVSPKLGLIIGWGVGTQACILRERLVRSAVVQLYSSADVSKLATCMDGG